MAELEEHAELVKAFDILYNKVIGLYTEGILFQYGISDEIAAGIVSEVAGLPIEKLKEMKAERDKNTKETMLKAQTANGRNDIAGMTEHVVQKP